MNRQLKTLWAVLAAGSLAVGAQAQDDRSGTAAMEELLVPVTPRTISLGNAITSGLSTLSGVEAAQSNPAALMTTNGTNVMFSRTDYIADIGINFFGAAQKFGNNTVSLSVVSWDYGDIPFTDESTVTEPNADITYDATSTVIGLSAARQFTDRIAAGFTVKGMTRSISESSAAGVGLDAGITYAVGESGLRFGVSLKNFGTKQGFSGSDLDVETTIDGPEGPVTQVSQLDSQEDELPSQLNFGVAYTRQFAEGLTATGIANFRSNAYDYDQYAGGVEVGYRNLLYVRGGIDLTSDIEMNAWSDWNIGAGLVLPVASTSISIDYAYRPSSVFSSVNVFSLSVDL